MEKAKSLDLLSGQLQTPPITYDLVNFFLVPDLYNRANIIFQLVIYKLSPNYLTRWTEQTYQVLQYTHTQFVNSNVSYYNPLNTLSIMFAMNPQALVV